MRCYRTIRRWRKSVQIVLLICFILCSIYIWKNTYIVDDVEYLELGGLTDNSNAVLPNSPVLWRYLANFFQLNLGQKTKLYKRTLRNDAKNRSRELESCPDESPFLEGIHDRLLGDMEPERLQELAEDFEMEEGGRIRPIYCQPWQRVALIIPYRGEERKLRILLHGLIHILYNQQVDATIFLIQQIKPSQFNIGALYNLGFLEARKLGGFDCFIFHAYNLVPANDRSLYNCGDQPKHFPLSIMHPDFKTPRLLSSSFFGGVVSFTERQYLLVNGHSNLYFDRGGYSQDMSLRLQRKNLIPDRERNLMCQYHLLGETEDLFSNRLAKGLIATAEQRQDFDGLSSIKYHVNAIKTCLLYTKIKVALDMTELKTASGFSKEDIEDLARGA